MPTPVISQPIMTAAGEAPLAIFCGRLETPPPSIEPTTRAVKDSNPSFPFPDSAATIFGVVADTDMIPLLRLSQG